MGPSDASTASGRPQAPQRSYSREYRDDANSFASSDNTLRPNGNRGSHGSVDRNDGLLPSSWTPKVLRYVPMPVQRIPEVVMNWVKGPQPPRPYKIEPFFPRIQTAPIKLLDKYFLKRKHKIGLLIAFYICWLIAFAAVLHKSAFASDIAGYGSPVRIGCTARYWADGNGCGLNGDQCRPFDNSTFTFRCPANCKRVQVFNPHAVGAREINYRPLIIGGPNGTSNSVSSNIYRGDSFICGAAIHAGFVRDKDGGCGALSLIGEQSNFPSIGKHGIQSIGFDSYFPLAFSFMEGTASQCHDLRWPLFAVSLTFTILLSLFTTSPAVFFVSIFTGLFFHVALGSAPPSLTDYYSIVSIALGRFLPAAFVAAVMYKYCIRRTLTGLTAQVEKTILWLGAAWVGALNNYTFDKIPIQRLTPHDIKQQPGAIPALIIIVLAIFAIALGQAWALRIEGRMPRYLALYITFGVCLLLLVAVPKMNVRLHHYILALLLLPGTSIQNRPSLLYQGLLIGLFINGIARWGFDSILQTPDALRGDAPLDSLLPHILPPVIHMNEGIAGLMPNITFDWQKPLPDGFDGMSVLVNDVERFRGYEDEGKKSFTWVRAHEGLPEYFRFGFMSGSETADYTKAGTWGVDGSWTDMKPGPSLYGNWTNRAESEA